MDRGAGNPRTRRKQVLRQAQNKDPIQHRDTKGAAARCRRALPKAKVDALRDGVGIDPVRPNGGNCRWRPGKVTSLKYYAIICFSLRNFAATAP
jgi:hypothetical protein